MHEEHIARLQRMPVFGGIRADILGLVLEGTPVIALPAGACFFAEGDPADSMFVLVSGQAVVVKRARGAARRIRSVHPGDCFGEMSLMDLSPRSASVQCLEACTAIEISAACLQRVYERDVEQFAILEMNMGREVSRRLREVEAAYDAVPASDGENGTR